MSKRQSAKPLSRWLTAAPDCRESRFIQVGNSLLFSKAAQQLSPGAFKLYLCCAMEAGQFRNFQLTESKAKQYGFAKRSFIRYRDELKKAGFIQVDKCGKTTREPNDYSFCFSWLEPP